MLIICFFQNYLSVYFVDTYKHIFFTPAEYNYYLMADYGHSVARTNTFLFDVQTSSTAHILLMKDRNDFDEDVYEIILGKYFCIDFFAVRVIVPVDIVFHHLGLLRG